MMIRAEEASDLNTQAVTARCPHCGRTATLDTINGHHDLVVKTGQSDKRGPISYLTGQRRCPNPDCRGHIFVLKRWPDGSAFLYPPERIDFEKKDVPGKVAKALEEAIVCHAGECYTAAAIMIRRTLEEICADRGAAGKDLRARIDALGGAIVLPQELIDAMHDLRILGNDAAHVESKLYDVGRDEVEAGIELAKAIVQAAYQYKLLVQKLHALKKPPA